MIRLAVSAVLCGAAVVGIGGAAADPVAEQLAAAKDAYLKANEKARATLVADLKRKADAAQKAGDLKVLEKADADLAAFEEKGVLPKSIPAKGYEGELKLSRLRLEAAYTTAVKEYTKLGRRAEARAVQQQLDDFKAGVPVPGVGARPDVTRAAPGLAARGGAAKEEVLKEFGGTAASEAAVARGLKWLARQQKPRGYWEFDPKDAKLKSTDWATATGLALLPFLGAGQTHRADGPYQKPVADGLAWLAADLNLATGRFAHPSPQYAYGHGIAALALCEAYAQTGDPALQSPAQAAVNQIVRGQATDGSWGYAPGTAGDTSIVGWQLQALFAARQGKLAVPDATIAKAVGFVNRVSSGPTRAMYGYAQPNGRPGTALSAVGLWCRYHFDGWTADTPGMQDGTAAMADPTRRPRTAAQAKANPATPELYYFYYATQVMHRDGGPAWQDWFLGPEENGARVGGMRDWLVVTQGLNGNDTGSWSPDPGTIGSHCGRVGSTALAVLILETPYRYLPLDRARP